MKRFCQFASLLFLASTMLAAAQPSVIKHVTVYYEPGRFGGWPANYGVWTWGDEILVGFSRGWYKDLGEERHNIDRERAEEHLFARSLDGGETWSIEDPSEVIVPWGAALHGVRPPDLIPKTPIPLTEPIRFNDPDFCMTLRMLDIDAGPSLYYVSYNRGHDWRGPYNLLVHGVEGIAARTDYLIDGPNACTLFLTAAKSNAQEGRPFCARTTDGGLNWNLVSWIGPEPEGFAIMPSTVRLSDRDLVTAVRRREADNRWIETWVSHDNGASWTYQSRPMPTLGEGNPPSMIRLQDGRLCLTYGLRAAPYEIRAQFSSDGGENWSDPFTLRGEGGGRDMGYPRTVQRPGGVIVTLYYFQHPDKPERTIEATLWKAD
ncbi:MAG: exo-alpha-sialidase [bacterium]|nr:exo-alpha-sialidase [bacterium]